MSQSISLPVASLRPANVAFDNTNANIIGPVSMKVFRRIMGHLIVGVVTANSNIQAYWQSSNASDGTFTNVSASSNTYTGALNTSNREYTLEIRADQLPANHSWVQLAVLVNVANAFLAASVYASESSYKPASQYDANTTVLPSRVVANI